MYVSYLQLDKDPAMYPHQNAVTRHPGISLSPQNFAVPGPPQYPDFAATTTITTASTTTRTRLNRRVRAPAAGARLTRLHLRPHGTSGRPITTATLPPPQRQPRRRSRRAFGGLHRARRRSPTLGFSPPEFPGQPPALLPASLNADSSESELLRLLPVVSYGKTRTKDKYRVVYTDHQRLELEKEFHYSKYITIRRKAELATALSLYMVCICTFTCLYVVVLVQVKIWFQNRRAKERKINKKKLQQPASSTTTPTPPTGSNSSGAGGGLHGNSSGSVAMVTSSSGSNGLVSPTSL
ncbi:hypothetical protein INR49_032449, partial [Caranx melampygus]